MVVVSSFSILGAERKAEMLPQQQGLGCCWPFCNVLCISLVQEKLVKASKLDDIFCSTDKEFAALVSMSPSYASRGLDVFSLSLSLSLSFSLSPSLPVTVWCWCVSLLPVDWLYSISPSTKEPHYLWIKTPQRYKVRRERGGKEKLDNSLSVSQQRYYCASCTCMYMWFTCTSMYITCTCTCTATLGTSMYMHVHEERSILTSNLDSLGNGAFFFFTHIGISCHIIRAYVIL